MGLWMSVDGSPVVAVLDMTTAGTQHTHTHTCTHAHTHTHTQTRTPTLTIHHHHHRTPPSYEKAASPSCPATSHRRSHHPDGPSGSCDRCALRAVRYALRAVCCVLCAACCVLRAVLERGRERVGGMRQRRGEKDRAEQTRGKGKIDPRCTSRPTSPAGVCRLALLLCYPPSHPPHPTSTQPTCNPKRSSMSRAPT